MADFYEGFYYIDNKTIFISEGKYWQQVKTLHLPEHSHNLNELTGCLYRQINYMCIEKSLKNLNAADPEVFEKCVHFFYYPKKYAQLIISDFLTKYMYGTPHSYINFENNGENTGELPFPYGKDFDFCLCPTEKFEQQFNIKVDNIVRLVGTPENFSIFFDNDCVYNFTESGIYVTSHCDNGHINPEDDEMYEDFHTEEFECEYGKTNETTPNEARPKDDASVAESMIGDSWHAKGRVMIAIGAIIAGALLAFIMK